MVDAPSNLLFVTIFLILLTTARITPLGSIPGWLKKFWSSADKKELIIVLGIDSKGINKRFSKAYSAIKVPSFA